MQRLKPATPLTRSNVWSSKGVRCGAVLHVSCCGTWPVVTSPLSSFTIFCEVAIDSERWKCLKITVSFTCSLSAHSVFRSYSSLSLLACSLNVFHICDVLNHQCRPVSTVCLVMLPVCVFYFSDRTWQPVCRNCIAGIEAVCWWRWLIVWRWWRWETWWAI